MAKNYPINDAWAENTTNKITITDEEFGLGITYKGPVVSSQLNSMENLSTRAIRYLQNTGGYWNAEKNYNVGDYVSIIYNSSVLKQNVIASFRCLTYNCKNKHPLGSSVSLVVSGDVAVYSGGTLDTTNWERISLDFDTISNNYVTINTEQNDITGKKTFSLLDDKQTFLKVTQNENGAEANLELNATNGAQKSPAIIIKGSANNFNSYNFLNIPAVNSNKNSINHLDYTALMGSDANGSSSNSPFGKYQGIYIAQRSSKSSNGYTMSVNCTNSNYTFGSMTNEIVTHKDLSSNFTNFTRCVSNYNGWETYNTDSMKYTTNKIQLPSIVRANGAKVVAVFLDGAAPVFNMYATRTSAKAWVGTRGSWADSMVFMPITYYYQAYGSIEAIYCFY